MSSDIFTRVCGFAWGSCRSVHPFPRVSGDGSVARSCVVQGVFLVVVQILVLGVSYH